MIFAVRITWTSMVLIYSIPLALSKQIGLYHSALRLAGYVTKFGHDLLKIWWNYFSVGDNFGIFKRWNWHCTNMIQIKTTWSVWQLFTVLWFFLTAGVKVHAGRSLMYHYKCKWFLKDNKIHQDIFLGNDTWSACQYWMPKVSW